MDKAQSSLEYLLLIGGAILVAVILIGIIISITSSAEPETLLATAHALCAKFPEQECAEAIVTVRGNTFICDNTLQDTSRAVRDAIPISPCGAGGMQPGKTYYLTQDIDNPSGDCFFISTSNVTLNCKNKTISVTEAGSMGIIFSAPTTNITIKNCKIVADTFGIFVASSNNFIINNIIITSGGPAIVIDTGASNNSIRKNNLCGAVSFPWQITIAEGASSQNTTYSGLNKCNICKDDYHDVTGLPSPVCVENGAIDKCPVGCD